MKKTFLIFFLIMAAIPFTGWGAEILQLGQPSPGKGIFLDTPTSFRLLEELETCRNSMEQLRTYQELDRVQQMMDKVRDEKEALLRERIAFLEKQQEELYKLNDNAIKTAEKLGKGPSIFERAFNAAGFIGIGAILVLTLAL